MPSNASWDQCSWIWRLTWYNGIGYGMCYGGGLCLLKTTDGVNFDLVCDLKMPDYLSETKIQFLGDGTMVALVRNDNGNDSFGWIGKSLPPYTDWKWSKLDIYLAGHDFIIDNDQIVVMYESSI